MGSERGCEWTKGYWALITLVQRARRESIYNNISSATMTVEVNALFLPSRRIIHNCA